VSAWSFLIGDGWDLAEEGADESAGRVKSTTTRPGNRY
jgi:hypothetical protein